MSSTNVKLFFRTAAWIAFSVWGSTAIVQADSGSANEPGGAKSGKQGVVDKVEDSTHKAGHEIEQGFKKAGEKIEEGARKTGEGLEKAGKKIEQKFGGEKDPAETSKEKEIQQKPGN